MLDKSLARAVAGLVGAIDPLDEPALELPWAWGAYKEEGLRFAFFRTYEDLREAAVLTAAARRAMGRPLSSAQQILGQYHEAFRDLEASLLRLPDGLDETEPAPDEWSVRRVLAHMLSGDLGFLVAVTYGLERFRGGNGRPAAIPEEAWDRILGLDEAGYRELVTRPLPELWPAFQATHERVLSDLADISDGELQAPSMFWEGYELSLRFRLHRFDSHLRQHTIQLDKTLNALGAPSTEVHRLLRLIYAALAEAEAAAIGAWDAGAAIWPPVVETIEGRVLEMTETLAMRS